MEKIRAVNIFGQEYRSAIGHIEFPNIMDLDERLKSRAIYRLESFMCDALMVCNFA